MPTAAINAAVDNGGKALVTGANATVGNLTIGATTAGSTVEVTSGTSLTINALTIGPSGTLISDVGSVFTQSGGFVNDGNLVVTAGTINSGPITGNGTVTKNDFGETVFWQAPLQAGSTIVVNAGTFVDESTAVGAVSVTGTGTFQVNPSFNLTEGATLNNGGALDNFGNVTGPADGVVSNAGGAVVTNETSGVITGGTGNGVNFAAGGTVTNLGRITASQFAGVFASGAAGNVTNSGTIAGNTAGVFLNAGGIVSNQVGGTISGNGNDAVFISGGNGTLTNSGTLLGPDGVRFQGAGVTGTVINNAGAIIQGATIQGALAVGVGTLNGATLNLTNSGTITGTIGVGLDQGGTIINNAGATITGTLLPAIEFIGTGNIVVFSNAGTVNGDVELGNFANALTLVTGGTINGSLNIGSATQASLTLDGGGAELISQAVTGTISGFSSLTKQGAGIWTIDENLAYGGGTIISGGTLRIGNGGTTGSITGNVVNNAALTFDRSDNITFGGTISGTGVLTQAGSGILTLTGNNTNTGGTTINAGTLQIGAGGIAGSIVGNVADNGILAFDRSDPVTFSGVISGAGSVRELGTGTLTLTGPNTYSGGTALNAGILAVNGDGNLGTGALSFNGGTLEALAGITSAKTISIAGGGAVFLADAGTSSILSGSISGAGSFAKIGQGTLTLTGSNTYSGGTALDNGALIVAATNALGTGPVTVNDPTLLQIDPHVTITNAIAISNGGTLINGGTIQVSATAGGPAAAITTSVGATITNESGGMIMGFGLIAIQTTSGTATITNSGVIEGAEGVALANGGTITNNAGATISASNGTAIASSGGSTNLSNAGVINGNVILGNGANTVQLFSGSRISGSLNLGPSAASSLILDRSTNQTYSQAVTGTTVNAGSLTKQGSGNWLIDVAMNASVSTKILAGVLTVNASLNSPEWLPAFAGPTVRGAVCWPRHQRNIPVCD